MASYRLVAGTFKMCKDLIECVAVQVHTYAWGYMQQRSMGYSSGEATHSTVLFGKQEGSITTGMRSEQALEFSLGQPEAFEPL